MQMKVSFDESELSHDHLITTLEEFTSLCNDEWRKQRKSIKLRVSGVSKLMHEEFGMNVLKKEDCAVLDIPYDAPDLDMLRNMLRRFGFNVGDPKWKDRMIVNLKGFLKEKKLKHGKVEWL